MDREASIVSKGNHCADRPSLCIERPALGREAIIVYRDDTIM